MCLQELALSFFCGTKTVNLSILFFSFTKKCFRLTPEVAYSIVYPSHSEYKGSDVWAPLPDSIIIMSHLRSLPRFLPLDEALTSRAVTVIRVGHAGGRVGGNAFGGSYIKKKTV